jgi:hypothetical protein
VLDFAQQEGKGREVAGIPGGCLSPAKEPMKTWRRSAPPTPSERVQPFRGERKGTRDSGERNSRGRG